MKGKVGGGGVYKHIFKREKEYSLHRGEGGFCYEKNKEKEKGLVEILLL